MSFTTQREQKRQPILQAANHTANIYCRSRAPSSTTKGLDALLPELLLGESMEQPQGAQHLPRWLSKSFHSHVREGLSSSSAAVLTATPGKKWPNVQLAQITLGRRCAIVRAELPGDAAGNWRMQHNHVQIRIKRHKAACAPELVLRTSRCEKTITVRMFSCPTLFPPGFEQSSFTPALGG